MFVIKMAAPMETTSSALTDVKSDIFMKDFKFFKAKNPPPDLSCVIDFSKIDESRCQTQIQRVELHNPAIPAIEGLLPITEWKAFSHSDYPGFTFIVNPFRKGFQRYWIKRCLEDYPCKPNICNLDAHMERAGDGNIWQTVQDQPSEKKNLLKKLRWVTLGYHHNWDTKQYNIKHHTPFPEDLGCLCKYFSSVLGYQHYTAEASIVNYYHLGSTLAGHTDHSEYDKEAPLFSISFGQTAIFLLGGTTKAEKPIAMYLNSGDIVVMAKQARLAYHAVPKILTPAKETLPDSLHEPNLQSCKSERQTECVCEQNKPKDICDHACMCHKITTVNQHMKSTLLTQDWEPFAEYMSSSRINMNVRQVFTNNESIESEHRTQIDNSSHGGKKLKLDKYQSENV